MIPDQNMLFTKLSERVSVPLYITSSGTCSDGPTGQDPELSGNWLCPAAQQSSLVTLSCLAHTIKACDMSASPPGFSCAGLGFPLFFIHDLWPWRLLSIVTPKCLYAITLSVELDQFIADMSQMGKPIVQGHFRISKQISKMKRTDLTKALVLAPSTPTTVDTVSDLKFLPS